MPCAPRYVRSISGVMHEHALLPFPADLSLYTSIANRLYYSKSFFGNFFPWRSCYSPSTKKREHSGHREKRIYFLKFAQKCLTFAQVCQYNLNSCSTLRQYNGDRMPCIAS